MNNLQICDNLKRLRKKAKLSREEIGEVCEVNPATYYRWERGEAKIPLEATIKLSEYYSVSIDEMIGIEKNQEKVINISSFLSTADKHSGLINLISQLPHSEEAEDLINDFKEMLEIEVKRHQDKVKQA